MFRQTRALTIGRVKLTATVDGSAWGLAIGYVRGGGISTVGATFICFNLLAEWPS